MEVLKLGASTGPEGFSFRVTKAGDVLIEHHGRVVTTLRGRVAQQFIARSASLSEPERQHLMARSTGNYKRGNESLASKHDRNR